MRRWVDIGLIVLSAAVFALLLLLPLAALALTDEEAQLQEAHRTGQIIRLHVVAHSDDPADQQLKLAVRDAVIARFGQMLSTIGQQDFASANDLLRKNLMQIQQTAESCARQHGFAGDVRAEAGRMHLPEKRYGSVTLPEGEYHALRITIGEGKGQNWWCVLYPQLCLALGQDESAEMTWHSRRIWRQWLALPV